MAFLYGQSGKVVVGSTDWQVESWSGNFNCEILDVTNTGSSGYEENISGIKSAEGTVSAYVDDSALPHLSSGLNVQPGNSATLKLYIANTGKFITVPARFGQVTYENPAKGQVKFNAQWKSNGAFTFPT